jgi:hypothetical protein
VNRASGHSYDRTVIAAQTASVVISKFLGSP